MAKTQWADGPFALIETPALKGDVSNKTIEIATGMALAHNCFFRGLNAIYLQAPFVKLPEDISDFLVYCQCWFESLSHHHDAEESVFFPAVAAYTGEKGIMDGNIEAHRAFHDGLEKFGETVYALKPDGYDGLEFQKLIDGFGEPFQQHMRDEIESLLALEKYGEDKLEKAYGELEKSIIGSANNWRQFPYGLGARDNTFENGMHHWPPVPFFVPYLVHYIFERKHRGAWRFAPSTTFGMPRKLAFLPDSVEK